MTNIRYQANVLEHFIPISLEKIISDLLNSDKLTGNQKTLFKQFCSQYIAVFHAQSYKQLNRLKLTYQPFNPDRDTLVSNKTDEIKQLATLNTSISKVLEKANYQKISEVELNQALNKTSPHGVKVSVDFEEFVDAALFYRGSALHTQYHRNWKKLQFRKKAIDIQIFRRLCIVLQPKNRRQWIEHLTSNENMSLKKAEKKADEAMDALGITDKDNSYVYMKLFKDIPRSDLEMLFPNTRIEMRLFDKIKLGIMGSGGTAGSVMATITKFSAVIDPVSAILTIGALLGVIWRQIAKVFSQRAKYSAILTKNLYFYSLDTNMGALNHLFDTAEAEECKEAILAYFFLLKNNKSSRGELDKCIEDYIQNQYKIPMDFEINDGLDKLSKSGLLVSHADSAKSVVSLEDANKLLIEQWNLIIHDKPLPNDGD